MDPISHCIPGPRFPGANPAHITETRESTSFNENVHLALEDPAYLRSMDGRDVQFPAPIMQVENVGGFGGLAYSAPFRVLSDEGVRALRAVLDANEKFATMVPGRIPKCIRGIGYRSKFIRDLGYSPAVLRHLSQCAGVQVTPHGMCSNLSQTNFGEIGTGVKVDQWHLDSVPYVMVLLMSDATDMVGGELQVARIPGDPRCALEAVKADEVSKEFIDTVKYPGPGYAIFMQGSRIAHGVTPVLSARERRLTVVNSYQSCNPFAEQRTVYQTFRSMVGDEGEHLAPFEYARHVAWRISGQMDYLLNKADYFGKDKRVALAEVLRRAAEELARAKSLILDETKEEIPYQLNADKIQSVRQVFEASKGQHRAKL